MSGSSSQRNSRCGERSAGSADRCRLRRRPGVSASGLAPLTRTGCGRARWRRSGRRPTSSCPGRRCCRWPRLPSRTRSRCARRWPQCPGHDGGVDAGEVAGRLAHPDRGEARQAVPARLDRPVAAAHMIVEGRPVGGGVEAVPGGSEGTVAVREDRREQLGAAHHVAADVHRAVALVREASRRAWGGGPAPPACPIPPGTARRSGCGARAPCSAGRFAPPPPGTRGVAAGPATAPL